MKKITLFFIILLSFLTLGAWTTSAWGATLNAQVGVGDGKGTATVEIYNGYGIKSAGPSSSTTSTLSKNISYSMSLVSWGYSVFTASPDNGYAFDAWYTNAACTTGKQEGSGSSHSYTTSTSKNKARTDIYYAKFIPVTVNSVASNSNPTANPLSITQPGAAGAKTATVVFNVSNADAVEDFNVTLTGAGWKASSSYANNQITVNLKYTATATTTQGNHSGKVTLTSKAANGTSQSADVFANVNLTPTISANHTSKNFGEYTLAKDTKKSQAITLTFNANAVNFEKTADASIAPFSAEFSANHQTLTVYFEPTTIGNWSKDLVVTVKNSQSTQLSATCTIHLSGSAKRNNVTYTCNIADNYMVDATAINLASLWTSNNNEKAPAYNIVSFTPSGSNNEGATAPAIDENNILSLGKAGTLVLSISQPQTTSFNKKDDTKTITIHKYTSTFANASNLTGKVGATNIQSNYTLTYVKPSGYVDNTTPTAGTPGLGSTSGNYYYTISQEVNRDNQVGCPAAHKDEVVVYNAGSKTATAWNKGVATISLKQKETYKFTEANTSFTITVDKNSNEVLNNYKWKDNNSAILWTRSLGFEDGAYVQFRSNNMESGAPHIIVRQIEGEDVASFYPDSVTNDVNGDAIYTSFTVGTASWKISQPEDYKYYAASERQFNLNVGESDCNCVLDEWSWADDLLHNPPTASEHNIVTFSGIGETLSFEARKKLAAGNQMQYKFYTNGEWSDATQITTHTNYETFGPYQLGEGDDNTTAVQFMKSSTLGGDTDDPFIKHIIVTRKRWMKLKATSAATATISSLAKLQRKVGTAEKTATFYVDFSTCSPRVKVGSNYGNVTFGNGLTKDTISANNTGKTGYNAVVPVTIHYSSDTIESKTVTITVYTEDKNATLTIPVQTTGIETEIVYVGNASYPVNSADIASTSLFEVRELGTTNVVSGAAVTISGSSDAASVVNNTLHSLCGDKSVNISAAFAGDKTHEPSVLATPQTIAITKIEDAVSFNSHPTVFIGKSYDISGWASANTLIASYTSSDNAIFSISGTTLTANAVGTATLTATASGDECTYISGATNSESITVQPGYIFNGTNDDQWEVSGNWENGDKPTGTEDVIIRGNLVIDDTIEVNSMTIENTGNVTLAVTGSLTVGSGNSMTLEDGYGNLHVQNGGQVNLTTGKLIVNDFVLDAELGDINHNGRSGQVHNMEQLAVNGDAYFDLALDPSGECSPGWYDFTVPFPVDAVNGITRFDNSTHLEKTIKCETNYAIMDFAESRRVETGYGWKKYHSVMQPGQCYTITIDDVDNIYRFKKTKTGAFNSSSTTSLAYSDVQNENRGWNCLGNGTLEYANISVEGIEKAHVYNHATNSYTAVPLNEYTYVVGSAYMIQTPTTGKEITYTLEGGMHTLRAPRRSSAETEFTLSLSREGNNSIDDRLYVGADEDATYNYEIGRELTKFAAPTDSKVAQVWANAYGLKLCDVEMPLVDNEAEVTLSFFAPNAGSYTLAIDRMPEDEADLYLTYNGLDIWNLTTSPYTIELAKGTTEGYGLRIQSRNTPQITTGVDEINGDKDGNRKVMVGNEIYIITKEGAIFNATGKKVK